MSEKGLSVMTSQGRGLCEEYAGIYFLTIQVSRWTQSNTIKLEEQGYLRSSVFLNISNKIWKFVIW